MRRQGSASRRLRLVGRSLGASRPSRAWLVGVLRSFVVSFLALSVTLWLLPGEQVSGRGLPSVALLVAAVLAIGSMVRPLLISLTVLTGTLGLLLAGLLAQSLILGIALTVVPGVEPFSFVEVVVAAWAATVVASFLNWVFDASTEEAFLGQVLGRAVRVARRHHVTGPGLLVVQLDGVSDPLLRQAMSAGAMPYLSQLLRSGSHRQRRWHTGLPSTTPAGQAVLLHGNTTAIPAFRWLDKDRGQVLVCSRPADAAQVERDLSTGDGLLAEGGVSVSNLFSGDAPTRALTMSDARLPASERGAASFFTSRTGFVRAVVLLVGQVVAEWHQGRRQRRRGVVPRVSRGGAFVLLRGLTTVVLRDLNVAIVAEQMASGAPVVFVDFVDYDEVAHHAGPSRPETLRTLEGLDRMVRFFSQVSEEVGRDYELVVLSDHGQAQGSTFRQLHGRSLTETVADLVAHPTQGRHHPGDDEPAEKWAPVNVLRALAGRGPTRRSAAAPESAGAPVTVMPSGSLAQVYVAGTAGRVCREELEERFPRLLSGLVALEHVGVVMTRRRDGGLVVADHAGWRELGPDGTHGGEGPDPLLPYGPWAGEDLCALDGKDHVGDVVLLGRFDPALGEVCAFEELVGSHGGLGGWQTHALFVHPVSWPVPEGRLTGLDVHELLLGRLRELGLRRTTVPGAAPVPEPTAAQR